MAAGNIGRISGIAAAQRDGQRCPGPPRKPRHQRLAGGQAIICQCQPSEPVVAVRIDAGLMQHQLRPMPGEQRAERRFQRRQIIRVPSAIGQADIVGGSGLSDWEILFGMDGKRDDVTAPGHDVGRAIALVHVAIDDQDAACLAFGHQPVGGDGEIIGDAITGTAVGTGMMAATGAVGGPAVGERMQACGVRAAGHQPRAAGDGGGNGQADAAFHVGRHGGSEHGIDIGRIMHGMQPFHRHQFRIEVCHPLPARRERRQQQCIFRHRKAVPRRQRRRVIGVEEQRERRRSVCHASARDAISSTSFDMPAVPAMRSSSPRIRALRAASNRRQRPSGTASRAALCGLTRSTAIN